MIGLLVLVAIASSTSSGFKSGNDLYSRCRETPRPLCVEYVMGVSDEILALQALGTLPKRYCPSKDVTAGQMSDVVVSELIAMREFRDMTAASLATHALLAAFPCPKSPATKQSRRSGPGG
jgi:hypothetical protein